MENLTLTLRHLRVFRAIMATGSATAAADRLAITQPAVSQQLAQLEDALGLKLFERKAGRLIATDPAVELHREVANAFDSIERIVNLASRLKADAPAMLRIGAAHSLGVQILPQICGAFAERYPALAFDHQGGLYALLAGQVASGALDLAILKLPMTHPGTSVLRRFEARSVCIIPARYPLAQRQGPLTPEDLRDVPLVMLRRNSPFRHDLEQALLAAGVTPRIKAEAMTVATCCGFASVGLGVAVVNELMATQFEGPAVVMRPLHFDGGPQIFDIIVPAGVTPPPLVTEFADFTVRWVEDSLTAFRQRHGI
ncbi:LysR substrate-binding domain-containing protein [Elstera cyanobacteriorum]|uniref:LysR substrate-binding domain-containing protein n=1 Tax=Elstera cyanobacteriorum TaxID=2022747 RepID=UPI00235743C9|nr:LysR substrate-binding domain-containing protein [Elstera cyanobacteriorum]MCK6443651.1 LysR substrate-binding domain-containing protein [Elstera cyanobacteriorum]